jgi:peptidoglycan/xylan/chitin deacetylase (PgdA/CDA1 family)
MSNSSWRAMIARAFHYSQALRLGSALSRSHQLHLKGRPGLRKSSGARFIILCYHRIGTGGIPFYSQLPAVEFEKQMRYLRKHCRLISLDQLLSEMQDPITAAPGVAVTFDDGYLGTFTEAFPILRKYSIPATVYLTVGCIETGEPAWYDRLFLALQVMPSTTLNLDLPKARRFELGSPESRIHVATEIITYLRSLPALQRKRICAALESQVRLPESELKNRMMTWDQIREMRRQDICFGAHTMTHPVLSRLDADTLAREIAESKRVLEERLGEEVKHFAYPFGKPEDCGAVAAAVLEELGFRSATTTVTGVNTAFSDRYQLRRVQIDENAPLPLFAFRLTRLLLQTEGELVRGVPDRSVRTATAGRQEANRA